MNIDILLSKLETLVKETGNFIASNVNNLQGENIESKGRHDLVTHIDKNAEKKLVEGLSTLLPEAGFITEEGTATHRGEIYNWVIDPIDGTTNFVHGIPPFCISVGLMEGDEMLLGAVYEIGQDEYFHAAKGQGAYLNHKKIHVSSRATLQEALVGTGFPYTNFKYKKEYNKAFDILTEKARGLRRYGSAAADLCYVACGRFDAFFEYGLHPWDVSAGTLIIEEAGGKVSDFKGERDFMFSGNLVACNSLVYDEFMDIIAKTFKN